MGTKREQHSVKAILAAIEHSGGIKQAVADSLGVHRHTITNYERKHSSVRQALQDEVDTVLDKAESNLFQSIQDGDIPTSQWLLRYKAKDRGYVEKSEISSDVKTILEVHYEK